jgi:hypothetical protein
MKATPSPALGALGIVWLLAGCTALPSCPCTPPPVLPLVQRGSIEPKVISVSARTSEEAEPGQIFYRGLSAGECQCLAARASTTANALEDEASTSDGHHLLDCTSERTELYQTVLHDTADELRNRSAGAALEAYFRLAEAEGRADLLRESLAEVDALVARSQELSAKGLQSRAAVQAFQRQGSQLRSDQIELRLVGERLDGQLKTLLGLSAAPCEEYRFWPTTPLIVVPDVIDVDACVTAGLTNRAELKLLRALIKDLNRRTLPVARLVLGSVNGLLGGPPKGGVAVEVIVKLWLCLNGSEVEAVRRQLQTLLEDRERQVVREIVAAAHAAEGRRQQVYLAQDRQKIDQRKVADLQEQADKGGSVQAELSQARLDAVKSRAELLSAVVSWELTQVQLKQAQGLLSLECQDTCACRTSPLTHPPAGRTPAGFGQ